MATSRKASVGDDDQSRNGHPVPIPDRTTASPAAKNTMEDPSFANRAAHLRSSRRIQAHIHEYDEFVLESEALGIEFHHRAIQILFLIRRSDAAGQLPHFALMADEQINGLLQPLVQQHYEGLVRHRADIEARQAAWEAFFDGASDIKPSKTQRRVSEF